MTDQTRAAFEAHFALNSRQKWQHKDGSYKDASVQKQWEGWQRALETVPAPTAHEPVAHVVDIDNGDTIIDRKLPVGTALYAAPVATPAPTAPSDDAADDDVSALSKTELLRNIKLLRDEIDAMEAQLATPAPTAPSDAKDA